MLSSVQTSALTPASSDELRIFAELRTLYKSQVGSISQAAFYVLTQLSFESTESDFQVVQENIKNQNWLEDAKNLPHELEQLKACISSLQEIIQRNQAGAAAAAQATPTTSRRTSSYVPQFGQMQEGSPRRRSASLSPRVSAVLTREQLIDNNLLQEPDMGTRIRAATSSSASPNPGSSPNIATLK